MGRRITVDSEDLVRAEEFLDPETMVRMLANGTLDYDETEDQLIKRCSTCRDYWPADSEFFYTAGNTPDRLHSMCKACYLERRAAA
jgi:hypothetical protein